MNRGTKEGDLYEINFVKSLNKKSNESKIIWSKLFSFLDLKQINKIYVVRVTKKVRSKIHDRKVFSRSDCYLIKADISREFLENSNYYLDEKMLLDSRVDFDFIEFSGISLKIKDSKRYQILKMRPKSFEYIIGIPELGAGASLYTKRKDDFEKNKDILNGWNIKKENFIKFFEGKFNFDKNDNLLENKIFLEKVKTFSNLKIKEIIDNNKRIQKMVFKGEYLYEEPYVAHFIVEEGTLKINNYIDFKITTGSGRSKGNYTIVLKPKK